MGTHFDKSDSKQMYIMLDEGAEKNNARL